MARLRQLFAVALTVSLQCVAPALPQDWPTRPVTMVVTFAAGGPNDVVARILASRMSEVLGQQIIVENVGGAGGMTGSYRVAKAPPDGYQFVYGNLGTHAQNQTLYKKPLYNSATDFAPVVNEATDRAKRPSCRHAARVHRLRKSQPDQNAIWVRGRRICDAYCLRVVQLCHWR